MLKVVVADNALRPNGSPEEPPEDLIVGFIDWFQPSIGMRRCRAEPRLAEGLTITHKPQTRRRGPGATTTATYAKYSLSMYASKDTSKYASRYTG
jgi:hypothetical protein